MLPRTGLHCGAVQKAASNTTPDAPRASSLGLGTVARPYSPRCRPRSWQVTRTTTGSATGSALPSAGRFGQPAAAADSPEADATSPSCDAAGACAVVTPPAGRLGLFPVPRGRGPRSG